MSPVPAEFRDRWKNRREPAQGFGTVYWHVLLSCYEGACMAAKDARAALSRFSGFHLTPPEWLHMTTHMVGPAENYGRDELANMIAAATETLARTAPIAVSISRVLYHPEAVMLAIDPAESLYPLRTAAEVASGVHLSSGDRRSPWVPHMTIGYSVASQSTEPVTSQLGLLVPTRYSVIDRLTLVIQWGPERSWDWEPVGDIHLTRNE